MSRFVIVGSLLILMGGVGAVGAVAQEPAQRVTQKVDAKDTHWLIQALEGDREVLEAHSESLGTCFEKSQLDGGVTAACSEWGTWDANGDCGGVQNSCCDRGIQLA